MLSSSTRQRYRWQFSVTCIHTDRRSVDRRSAKSGVSFRFLWRPLSVVILSWCLSWIPEISQSVYFKDTGGNWLSLYFNRQMKKILHNIYTLHVSFYVHSKNILYLLVVFFLSSLKGSVVFYILWILCEFRHTKRGSSRERRSKSLYWWTVKNLSK